MQQSSEFEKETEKAMRLIFETAEVNNIDEIILFNTCVNIIANLLVRRGIESHSIVEIIDSISNVVRKIGGAWTPAEDLKEKLEEISTEAIATREK